MVTLKVVKAISWNVWVHVKETSVLFTNRAMLGSSGSYLWVEMKTVSRAGFYVSSLVIYDKNKKQIFGFRAGSNLGSFMRVYFLLCPHIVFSSGDQSQNYTEIVLNRFCCPWRRNITSSHTGVVSAFYSILKSF